MTPGQRLLTACAEISAAHLARHDHVGEHEVDPLAALKKLDCRLGVLGFENAVTYLFELPHDDLAHFAIVLDGQHGHARPGDGTCRRAAPRARDVFRGLLGARQIEAHGRTVTDLAVNFDVPSRLLDEAEHHGQSQPGT